MDGGKTSEDIQTDAQMDPEGNICVELCQVCARLGLLKARRYEQNITKEIDEREGTTDTDSLSVKKKITKIL